ncbi:maestro heat-like repeat family member 5 isoform X3 [Hyaena hyaena]|uniref:maestro heat-like repeat family member 5 isoform X3 n=1 Tax=Hyaena hyaena TaxID=95912 RepID=UPI001921A671|nr:maestro heat-like repeat family member 5 isoform X3 [Hyaena hyaena]
MEATPSEGFCPHWRSSCLSPTGEEELNAGHPGGALLSKSPRDRPLWEEALVSNIRAMSALQKSLVLETIQHHIQERTQLIAKEAPSAGIQELLAPLNLELKQPLEKTFLFHLYGLILRECNCVDLVRRHLASLLELSHQSSSQREGIAMAVGIASSTHMQEAWAMLEHVGRTRFLRTVFMSPDSQQPDPDTRWTWVGSTSLLCYGQMAAHAGEQILPWVDNIVSRMVYYFSCSRYDNILKTSFLSATIMLLKALRQKNRAQSYKFTQIPELIQCLLSSLQKEPNFLATLFRQKIILVIAGLSNLRPSLKPMVKSRILQTCLQSLYTLPPTETLRSCLPPMDAVPDVMHVEPWLESDRSHERQRAVQTVFLLLTYVVDNVGLAEVATPSVLGHQIGLLALLWRDMDPVTQSHSRQCTYLFLQLLTQQKGSMSEFMYLNKMKNLEASASRKSEIKFYNLVKVLNRNLTVAQHTQLVLTLLGRLCSHSRLNCDLASQLLLKVIEEQSVRPEQVAEILHGLFRELPSITFKSTLQTMMKAVSVLGTQHTQETVEVILSLCHPSERQVMPLWKALASSTQLARKVLTMLYMKLKLRPPKELIRFTQQAELISLLALGTIYELLYTREFKATVRWAFAGVLVGLLTQLHYLFELDVAESSSDYQEEVLDVKPLGPCRTCLEALKGLFWTNCWEVFAFLKLLRGWELLEHMKTYTEGVTLLARAMAHYDCEIKAVWGQAVISLKSSEERDNVVAILLIAEFLNSQELPQYMSRRTMDNFLSLGLNNPNQLVRAMSLKGLSSILMHPKKVMLLRNRLAGLLDGFLGPEPKDLVGLMEILGDILRHLGSHGVGATSLRIAQHLLLLFDDEEAAVRGRAILLYGDVLHSGGNKYRQALKSHAFQALVPLLLHLGDSCPAVVMKTKLTFLRCAVLLKWEFRKELFGKLAWGRGLGAENNIFIYVTQDQPPPGSPGVWAEKGTRAQSASRGAQSSAQGRKAVVFLRSRAEGHIPRMGCDKKANPSTSRRVESNFGNFHQFFMQALVYLRSPNRRLKQMAMKFVGALLQDYFTDLCFYLSKDDVRILKKHLETLKQDPDSMSRKFYNSFVEDLRELSQFVTQ